MTNRFREHPQRVPLETFETFDQSDEKIWSDQQEDNDKDKYNEKDKDNDNCKNTLKEQSQRLVAFVTLVTFLTIENNNLKIHSDPSIKSDRDSIRNSCDVLFSLLSCEESVVCCT